MDLLYELKIIFERFSFSIYVLNSLLKESWAFEVKEKIGYVGYNWTISQFFLGFD